MHLTSDRKSGARSSSTSVHATVSGLRSELSNRSEHHRHSLLRREARRWGTTLVELLLERCRASWTEDPREAEELAGLALEVLELIGGDRCERIDLAARAWAYRANARRIYSDLSGADEGLGQAEKLWGQGTKDPRLRAQIFDLRASLLRDQRRFAEAIGALDRSMALYRWARDPVAQARVMIKRAMILIDAGEPAEAIPLLEQAAGEIDPTEHPHLACCLAIDRVLCLNEAGRPEAARALLPQAWRLARQGAGRLDLLRLRWLEGQVASQLGDAETAEAALRQARQGFLEERIGYDAALVSLDLAALLLAAGRTTEVRELARQMHLVFQSLEIERGAFMALALFQQAALAEKTSLQMIHDVATCLRRTRATPALRYERPS